MTAAAFNDPSASAPLLQLCGVSKRFGGVVALDRVDFDVRAGEIHGLIGENGAGKSTMMKLLSGAYGSDYTGEMRLQGQVVRFGSPADAHARGIGMVYQELSVFSHLTVAENIFGRNAPARFGFVDWRRMNRLARIHLTELGVDLDVTHTMGGLAVGNQQLVEIARVIFSGARVIILDEPTSALSPPETQRLLTLMATLKAQGKTMILISHFLDEVLEVADRVTVLKNSRGVAVLNARQTSKHEMIELMIGADAPILRQIEEAAEEAGEGSGARNRTDGAAVSAPAPASPTDPAALVATGLTKRGAFEDVSLQLHKGEILGLFAFMGAGQMQLGRCLFGAEGVDRGALTVEGQAVRLRNTTQARACGIAFVPENRRDSLMLGKEIFKNITLAHLRRLIGPWLDESAEIDIALTQMQRLGVRPGNPRLPVGALSGGNQQKVVLGKWLTRMPRILILNEPTRGMDVGAKDEVITIVKRLRDEGVAILLITTQPETIVGIADRALVMRKGRITAALEGPALTKEQLIKSA